tara:strand:+ start:5069 stop:5461 length:393 start_codon:yes stop_codon:yes gene_type:complete
MVKSEALKSATILIVDDDANVISSVKRAFRAQPFRILGATNGENALQFLEEESVDLVICDARMPGTDGPALLSTIESRWPDCMRILLTGYEDIEQTIRRSTKDVFSAISASRGMTGCCCWQSTRHWRISI